MNPIAPADPGRWMFVVAAEIEARALWRGLFGQEAPALQPWRLMGPVGGPGVVMCGVGKANAAGATARFADGHSAVVSIGICGALPGPSAPSICDVVVADRCVWADEGVLTPEGFVDCQRLGFPLGPYERGAVPVSDDVSDLIAARLSGLPVVRGGVATVSTCSGTDALAADIAARTGAIAEGMEGAAATHVALMMGLPRAEVRVVSNTTGDRGKQRWEMKAALDRLEEVGRCLRAP